MAMADADEDFSHFAWGFGGNKPIQNTGPPQAQSPLSEKVSKASGNVPSSSSGP
jgi:hypothetical protein